MSEENISTEASSVLLDLAKAALKAKEAENRELVEALRLTVEYVGTHTLRPEPGWSWYDALTKYAPEVAERFAITHAHMTAPVGSFGCGHKLLGAGTQSQSGQVFSCSCGVVLQCRWRGSSMDDGGYFWEVLEVHGTLGVTAVDRCDPSRGYHATPHRGCILR